MLVGGRYTGNIEMKYIINPCFSTIKANCSFGVGLLQMGNGEIVLFANSLGGVPELLSKILNKLPSLMFVCNYYRAMHFSAYARSWDRMSSVCPSVCDVGGL